MFANPISNNLSNLSLLWPHAYLREWVGKGIIPSSVGETEAWEGSDFPQGPHEWVQSPYNLKQFYCLLHDIL